MKITIILVGLIVFLILRRTRFRNRYPVMSDEWMEYQEKKGEEVDCGS